MLKKSIPHIVALLIFISVSALYFAPQYQGKAVRQGDDIQAIGMQGGMQDHIQKYGEHPQWAPNMFSGMPAYLISMNYDGRIIKSINDTLYFLGTPAAYYFILMAGFYLMLLCFGINPYLSIIGALAYGLSSYFFIIFEAGHITKLIALAYIAPMVGAVYYTYTKNVWIGCALTGIFASIEISASHPQITYYFIFVILGLIIARVVYSYKHKLMSDFFKRSGALLIAASLAIGSNIIQLWYIADYAKDSIRSKSELVSQDKAIEDNKSEGLDKDYITQWSYGKMETLNMFIPNLYGGTSSGGFSENGEVSKSLEKYNAKGYAASMPGYWGAMPFTSGPVYVGAIVVFLFCMGIFLVKGANLWWLLSVTILSILLAWGKNMMWFTDIFIDYVPGYNKFRTVSMILVIAEWSMPLLGMLALNKIFNITSLEKEDVIKAIKKALYITAGISLFFIVMGGGIFDFSSETDSSIGLPEDVVAAMRSERAVMMRADAFRSLIFVLLAAIVVWLFVKEKLKRSYAIAGLAILVLCDMIPVNKRYLNNGDFKPKKEAKAITPTKANLAIMSDTTLSYRVANLSLSTFQDATTSYFHKSVGGYHAAKMRRYQEIIEKYLIPMDIDIYSMLNTRYFIVPDDKTGDLKVQINPDAYGNAWFVDKVDFVSNANEELDALEDTNLKNVAVVDKKFEDVLKNVSTGGPIDSLSSISLIGDRINMLKYKSNNSNDAIAVFSEIYYPKGWDAYIDGVKTPYFRADYILRAMYIPSGEHIIEFRFAPPYFNILKTITIVSSLLLLVLLALGVFMSVKKR